MTILILLPAPTRTRIIPADLRSHLHRLLSYRLGWFVIIITSFLRDAVLRSTCIHGGRSHLILPYAHFAHIRLLFLSFPDNVRLLVPRLDCPMVKETYDIPVYVR